MRIEDIEIHAGPVDFQYEALRKLEAKCEAPTAMSKAPTIEDVNAKLREMAAGLGANAVIDVKYESGATMTSWRSMRGYGVAVKRLSDDMPCPVCAETIKRAAKKCRFCGADIASMPIQPAATTASTSSTSAPAPAVQQEPLRSTDNPRTMTYVVVAIIILFFLLLLLSQ